MTTTQTTAPLLHRFLLIGLVMLAAVFVFLRSRGMALLPPEDNVTRVIGYTLSALPFVLIAVALLLLKPRVPARGPRQSIEEYWSDMNVNAKVFPVWFIMEGAGMTANIGYFLTGEPVAAVAMGLAIVAFAWCGPNAFAKA